MKCKQHHFTILTSLLIGLLLLSCNDTNDDTNDKKNEAKPIASSKLIFETDSLEIAMATSIQIRLRIENVAQEDSIINWSTNSNALKIDASGVATGMFSSHYNEGAYIVATLANGKASDTCYVHVYRKLAYKIRITLKDKGASGYSTNKPEEFLSQKAIDRRKKSNIAIDASDLPISLDYINQINKLGGKLVVQSKWMNTVCVETDKDLMLDKYKALPFVKDAKIVWYAPRTPIKTSPKTKLENAPAIVSKTTKTANYYGAAWTNIQINNGQLLHNAGYKGQGIDIAIIDGGFLNLLSNPKLKDINLKGAKTFIANKTSPYQGDIHGLMVTSCMATNKPGEFVGTAPEAAYWLFDTEDPASEYAIEEDYWTAAAEYADSVGVDIINTSLGYLELALSDVNYSENDLDGKTMSITQAANAAVAKGIFVVCSVGNTPGKLSAPGDAFDILSVGGVNANNTIYAKSSSGFTSDQRMKPDVLALAYDAGVVNPNGGYSKMQGTSFSSPIMCGLVACLKQAYPKLTNRELLDVIRQSGNKYNTAGGAYGYGIADMQRAMQLADEK